MNNTLVHHHLLFYATVGRQDLTPESGAETILVQFLDGLVSFLQMKKLIEPIVLYYESNDAYTGIVVIATSHIAFHYFRKEQFIQMDIYSCKPYDKEATLTYCLSFWKGKLVDSVFMDRLTQTGQIAVSTTS